MACSSFSDDLLWVCLARQRDSPGGGGLPQARGELLVQGVREGAPRKQRAGAGEGFGGSDERLNQTTAAAGSLQIYNQPGLQRRPTLGERENAGLPAVGFNQKGEVMNDTLEMLKQAKRRTLRYDEHGYLTAKELDATIDKLEELQKENRSLRDEVAMWEAEDYNRQINECMENNGE